MAKVEDALRDLIRYHGKRAATEVLDDLPAQLRQARREIRALQKEVEELAAQVKALIAARQRAMAVPPAPGGETEKVRFSRRTLRSIRRRFDLTQQELAELLEVSPVTVTAWETGKSRPRKANLAQIVTLREMDQAQVDKALGRESVAQVVRPDQLKKLRDRLDLTQAELAGLIGVSVASVTSWETGKTTASRRMRRKIGEVRGMAGGDVDERLGRGGPGRLRGAPKGGSLSPDEIRQIRLRVGLSQRRMAQKLGVSVNTISNWETGRTVPRGGNVQKLAELRAKGEQAG